MTRVEREGHPQILVVDDHPLVAECVATVLRREGLPTTVAGPDLSTGAVLALATRARALGAVVDLWLGRYGSATKTIAVLAERGVRVCVLTEVDDEVLLAEALEAGARDLFTKDMPFDELASGLRGALTGQTHLSAGVREYLLAALRSHRRNLTAERRRLERLTPRQADMLAALVEGHSALTIAKDLGVSLATVRAHIRGLLANLEVNSQLAAVAVAHRVGWLPGDRSALTDHRARPPFSTGTEPRSPSVTPSPDPRVRTQEDREVNKVASAARGTTT